MTHSLQLRLARLQNDMAAARRLLRRVRRLYIRAVYLAVMTDPTNGSIERAAQRMLDVGMYASLQGMKNVRYTILRRCWTLNTGKSFWRPGEYDGWHCWYQRQGFIGGEWLRPEQEAKSS